MNDCSNVLRLQPEIRLVRVTTYTNVFLEGEISFIPQEKDSVVTTGHKKGNPSEQTILCLLGHLSESFRALKIHDRMSMVVRTSWDESKR